MEKTIYGSVIKSKTNLDISLYINSKPVFSLYNPENEAENFSKIQNQSQNENFFFVTTGMAQGYHIFSLLKHFPTSKILILEKYKEDFYKKEFSKTFSTLKEKENIIFSTIDTLEVDIINNYLPATDGDFIYRSLRSWLAQNNDCEALINNKIKTALQTVKDDYSVQAHFGKLWFVNFCKNLNLIKKYPENITNISNHNFPKNKVAAIVSAGPTLDSTIEKIKDFRDKYYVISTDTAYQTLIKCNIIPDVFVTIDAQHISCLHALKSFNNNTLLAADLCGNNSIIYKAIRQNCKIIFSCNNNPFTNFAEKYLSEKNCNIFIKLNSGSGTVTMTALDFACKAGFKNIEFFGTDFSYQNGKPYCKGTYLDRSYFSNSIRTKNFESNFCRLMYRSELQKLENNKFSSHILNSYKDSFINFTSNFKELQIYSANGKIQNESYPVIDIEKYKYNTDIFINNTSNLNISVYSDLIKELFNNLSKEIENNIYVIYPLLCNIKMKNQKNAIKAAENLAKKIIANYN